MEKNMETLIFWDYMETSYRGFYKDNAPTLD